MLIVTAGNAYIDIDALAGITAFAALQNLRGVQALSYTSATPNASVTPTLLDITKKYLTEKYVAAEQDTFALIDLSDPHFFDSIVELHNVSKVIDHHPGHEQYWQDKIGENAIIEPIGAACTLVFEQWEKAGMLESMPADIALLLLAGILDNTLYLKATLTSDRDKHAYKTLLRLSEKDESWAGHYFSEIEIGLRNNLSEYLKNDTKIMNFDGTEVTYGQAIVWDAGNFIKDMYVDLTHIYAASEPWVISLFSLSDGKDYFLSKSTTARQWIVKNLGGYQQNEKLLCDRFWLRKEINRLILSK